jgi:hypothetical protein
MLSEKTDAIALARKSWRCLMSDMDLWFSVTRLRDNKNMAVHNVKITHSDYRNMMDLWFSVTRLRDKEPPPHSLDDKGPGEK